MHEKKNGFVTATKLGTTNEVFVASTKKFAVGRQKCVSVTGSAHWELSR